MSKLAIKLQKLIEVVFRNHIILSFINRSDKRKKNQSELGI